MSNEDLFDLLIDHFGVEPDSDGEVRVDCPNCGKEAKRGQTHFSFSERGGHCFVCGTSWSLRRLAEEMGIVEVGIIAKRFAVRDGSPPRRAHPEGPQRDRDRDRRAR